MPGLKARYAHCGAAYNLSPGKTEIVIFGGNTTFPQYSNDISDTTVLRFGEC